MKAHICTVVHTLPEKRQKIWLDVLIVKHCADCKIHLVVDIFETRRPLISDPYNPFLHTVRGIPIKCARPFSHTRIISSPGTFYDWFYTWYFWLLLLAVGGSLAPPSGVAVSVHGLRWSNVPQFYLWLGFDRTPGCTRENFPDLETHAGGISPLCLFLLARSLCRWATSACCHTRYIFNSKTPRMDFSFICYSPSRLASDIRIK